MRDITMRHVHSYSSVCTLLKIFLSLFEVHKIISLLFLFANIEFMVSEIFFSLRNCLCGRLRKIYSHDDDGELNVPKNEKIALNLTAKNGKSQQFQTADMILTLWLNVFYFFFVCLNGPLSSRRFHSPDQIIQIHQF